VWDKTQNRNWGNSAISSHIAGIRFQKQIITNKTQNEKQRNKSRKEGAGRTEVGRASLDPI
jgi:hypothetical protein